MDLEIIYYLIIFILLLSLLAIIDKITGKNKKKISNKSIDVEIKDRNKSLENTEIKDRVEKWFQDVYMCWIIQNVTQNKEYWNKIAGRDKNQFTINDYKTVLSRDWSINNKEELLKQVEILKGYDGGFRTGLSWDLCRAMQILGMGYICDYITRDEMREYSIKVGKIIQEYFSGWDDLIENYLIGYRDWYEYWYKDPNADKPRRKIFEMLKKEKLAFQEDWNLELK